MLLHCDGAAAGLGWGIHDVVDVADADALGVLQAAHRGAVALVRRDERCRVIFPKDRVHRVVQGHIEEVLDGVTSFTVAARDTVSASHM